ncbi:MAG: tetratricopeptide repeat protein, partial [Planctomycetota bacterium]
MIASLILSVVIAAPATRTAPQQAPAPTPGVVEGRRAADARVIDLHRTADAHLMAGRYREARTAFTRALSLRPADATLTYGLCCALARLGEKEEALAALRDAMSLGYGDARLTYMDPDVLTLRSDPRFFDALPESWKNPRPDASAWAFGNGTDEACMLPGKPARFAHALGDGSLQIRSCESGEVLATTEPAASPLASLGASSDGRRLAMLYSTGEMAVLDVDTMEVKDLEPAIGVESSYWTSPLSFAANDSVIVAWTNRGPLTWSVDGAFRYSPTRKNRKGSGWRTCQLTGTHWLPEIEAATVHLHPLRSSLPKTRRLDFPHDVSGLNFSPDGRLLAIGTAHGGVHVVEIATGEHLWSQTMTDSSTGSATDVFGSVLQVPTLCFDPTGNRLAVCTTTGYFLGVYDVTSGKQLWRTGHLGGRMGASMALVQGESLVIGDDGRLAWDGVTGKRILSDGDNPQETQRRAFAALGGDVLVATDDAFLRVDVRASEVVWRVERTRRDPWLVEHPSGWFAGRFDANLAGRDPRRDPARFDPKRLRMAARGAPLGPPPASLPAADATDLPGGDSGSDKDRQHALLIRLHRSADETLSKGNYEASEAAFVAALELAPKNATLTYGLACALSKQGKSSAAMTQLVKAIELGYADDAVIRWDSDIWSLRSDPRFWDVVPRPRDAGRSDGSPGPRGQSTGWAFRSSGVSPA